ncbi:CBS domain-containing protein [Streptomyces virginiae]|uniref:CBS domain-containing protein n=1 Tax=Streptomyces virginiae TaxID=1961 RepID=UPI00386D2E06|nr:CBS domain-containing protein [Streptomyces virginiae]
MPSTPSEQQLRDLRGKELPVLDLLALFGARRRDPSTVLAVEAALNAAGLSTVPYFATCGHHAEVFVQALGTPVTVVQDSEESDADADLDDPAEGLLPQRPLSIGDVLPPGGGLMAQPPSASLETVTHLMRHNNFSQVPIIEGQNILHGVVTWRSVARMYEFGLPPTVANASEHPAHWAVAQDNQDFFSLLPMISEQGYALIRGNDGTIRGIVTAADITERFAATARPFFLIGEIEMRLRKCLGKAIGPDAIRAIQPNNRKTGQISDLQFGDYVVLLDGQQRKESLRPQADQNWLALQWPWEDRVQFVRKLDRVRIIRNKVAHFDPQPLSGELHDELEKFCLLLRHYVQDI